MKPLILLLFFTFTAGAQELWIDSKRDTSVFSGMRLHTGAILRRDSMILGNYHFADPPHQITVQGKVIFPTDCITLSDLEGYLAECEADSSEWWGPVVTSDGKAYGNYRQWRKPEPTLKGFLEYLKRKGRK